MCLPAFQVRRPGTSFADKNSVQRLAGDALQGFPHVTTFNLQVGPAEGGCSVKGHGKEAVRAALVTVWQHMLLY